MLILAMAFSGALIGWVTASRKEGDRSDKLQYMTVYAMGFAVFGVFLVVILDTFAK